MYAADGVLREALPKQISKIHHQVLERYFIIREYHISEDTCHD